MTGDVKVTVGGVELVATSIKLGALKRGIGEKLNLGRELFTMAHADDLFECLVEGLGHNVVEGVKVDAAWLGERVRLIDGAALLEAVLAASGFKEPAADAAAVASGEARGP